MHSASECMPPVTSSAVSNTKSLWGQYIESPLQLMPLYSCFIISNTKNWIVPDAPAIYGAPALLSSADQPLNLMLLWNLHLAGETGFLKYSRNRLGKYSGSTIPALRVSSSISVSSLPRASKGRDDLASPYASLMDSCSSWSRRLNSGSSYSSCMTYASTHCFMGDWKKESAKSLALEKSNLTWHFSSFGNVSFNNSCNSEP
mmetsp:Transcript_31712/g.90994  ORF Transcript_31712/g.90994 Transcript_31712/m.90994 type:complete len:202 (-) Transcript_31712:315-920(-)